MSFVSKTPLLISKSAEWSRDFTFLSEEWLIIYVINSPNLSTIFAHSTATSSWRFLRCCCCYTLFTAHHNRVPAAATTTAAGPYWTFDGWDWEEEFKLQGWVQHDSCNEFVGKNSRNHETIRIQVNIREGDASPLFTVLFIRLRFLCQMTNVNKNDDRVSASLFHLAEYLGNEWTMFKV